MTFKFLVNSAGADPGFQVGGAHLKKLRRAEGDAKIFGLFRVKNHDFMVYMQHRYCNTLYILNLNAVKMTFTFEVQT
jgi:hypothetical protein